MVGSVPTVTDMSPDDVMARSSMGAVPAGQPTDMLSAISGGLGHVDGQKMMQRDVPEVDEARAQLVEKLNTMVTEAKEYWKPVFDKMRDNMDFAAGKQWTTKRGKTPTADTRYVANIVHRHIQQKVSGLYARNPRVTAKRKEKLIAEVWDGTNIQVQQAMQMLQVDPANATSMQILRDFNATVEHNQLMDRVAKTLELVYGHNINEQELDYKGQMKGVVRRAITTGVGYVKLGFQRIMQLRPEVEKQISDLSGQLAAIERLSADIADGEEDPQGEAAERLRLMIAALQKKKEVLLREGLTLSYPDSLSIIVDRNCRQLKGFVGADWVCEEFVLTPDKVKEIYKVDVGAGFTAYSFVNGVLRDGNGQRQGNRHTQNRGTTGGGGGDRRSGSDSYCVVREIYHRGDGLVYVTCDGYPDFLVEPSEPDVWMERFYPWLVCALNEIEHYEDVYPLSDVTLIRDMQLEINASRQGLRQHRVANRPKTAVAAGLLSEEDIEKLKNHPANAVLELESLQPGQKIEDVLQPIKMPGIDPNIYDVSPSFQDIERTVGVQEANLGGTSGGTATESSISESSRMTQMASNIDDINDLLTELAQAGGQILLSELSPEAAKKIAGPAAVWPSLTREEISDEIELKVEAGSTGRPNQAMEIANAERLMPVLLQIPGINPEYIALQLLKRLDDNFDMSRAFTTGLPSIMSMNAKPAGGAGAGDPNAAKGGKNAPAAQGGQGAMNGEKPDAGLDQGDPMAVPQPKLYDYAAGKGL